MIAVDVVKIKRVSENIYHNDGTVKVLVNPAVIAEIWPVETLNISERTADKAARWRVIGTVRVATLYTLNGHDNRHFMYITAESYQKLVEKLDEDAADVEELLRDERQWTRLMKVRAGVQAKLEELRTTVSGENE